MASKTQPAGATTKLSQHEIIPHKTDVGALANRINMETRALHNKIDRLVTLKFAIALRNHKVYRQGLQSFYHVFATVEDCLYAEMERPGSPWSETLRKVWKPEMARTARGQQDLMFYYDDDQSKFMAPMMPAQIEFVSHIRAVVADKPYLLLAYLHVMYLALFAGGRVMRSSVSRATGLFPQKDGLKHEQIVKLGTNFFLFDVPDEENFRLLYKRDYELLTRNFLNEQQKTDIIAESMYIFEQNARCVNELQEHNLAKILHTWQYFVWQRGGTAAVMLVVLLAVYYMVRFGRWLGA
ncbi:heme oxygenase [Metschnikowia bicuspidata var. bicuspidata NRRL YB-4993]|uniref:Heme oxygenase n=1 Tax=Metschnikowia bicuspidata var. bicuspidata NRRL YB-4993 TaxID=869754 RepID=A0A1A0H513_9ASCO|nr:heme oxygenase [Metschnikowia bicuspidata var. bicuspidata NRRL YB-4993]OBA19126.1 heme oxygenase [Metschnikowia bicuspidata var. bicuspidata NRRL YB-4993]